MINPKILLDISEMDLFTLHIPHLLGFVCVENVKSQLLMLFEVAN